MKKEEQKNIVVKVMPDIFVKKILGYPYENIGFARVFNLEDAVDIEQVCASQKVLVCTNVDVFKEALEAGKKANLYVSKNLVNRLLLEELLNMTSQHINVFWGIE